MILFSDPRDNGRYSSLRAIHGYGNSTLNQHARLEFYSVKSDHTSEFTHIGIGVEFSLDEDIERFDILDRNNKNEIGVACDHIALGDFLRGPHSSFEFID